MTDEAAKEIERPAYDPVGDLIGRLAKEAEEAWDAETQGAPPTQQQVGEVYMQEVMRRFRALPRRLREAVLADQRYAERRARREAAQGAEAVGRIARAEAKRARRAARRLGAEA